MNTRRMTLALGAAAGGVLAAGFLSTAVAVAAPAPPDPGFTTPGTDAFTLGGYTFDPYLAPAGTDPVGLEGFSPITVGDGTNTTDGAFETGNVDQNFDVFQTLSGSTTPTDIGSIATNENVTTLFGINSTGFTVTGSTPDGTLPTGATLPADGSNFDVTNYGSGYINNYSDIVGGTSTAPTNTVTDILDTPYGDYNLSQYATAFDLALLDPASAFGSASDAAAGAATSVDPLAFLGL